MDIPSTDKKDRFLLLVATHKGILYKVAHTYCRHAEDREDLVQEIIFQLWRSFDRYTDTTYKYSTLVYKVALNTAISFYRKESRRKQAQYPLSGEIFHLADTAPETGTEENTRLLLQFITELKELDKALILLYLEEKTHKEIAEIIGISETNVGTKISRIKTVLSQKFLQIKND